MTDNKSGLDGSSGQSNTGIPVPVHESKRMKPKYHSQLSNVSFSSFAESLAGGSGTSRSSPSVATMSSTTLFPRVSLRSLLLNSPFSIRTKPKRGCNKSTLVKIPVSSETPEKVYLTPPELGSTHKSSLRRQPGTRSSISSNSSLRRSSGSCSKTPSADESKSKILNDSHHDFQDDLVASNPELNEVFNEPSTSAGSGLMKECSLCLQELEEDKFPVLLTCSHTSCLSCMKQYLIVEITESRVNISCPQCHILMHPTDIHQILNNSILSYKYEDFMLRRVLAIDPDTRWCPAPDCGYAVIAAGCASCPKLKCERAGCESYFCYHCKAQWHPNQTCDMARAQRSPNAPLSSFSYLPDFQNNDDVKSCPRCQVLIVKMDDGSCNHITCSVCGAEFCWLCLKEISDLHYLSPSGCTFWGKKPWTRKKKILWQLGTLVGAPLGIGLVAGLAVPAMVIGIPIWVGRKLHTRYANKGKHRRNIAMVGGVTASAIISPVLAGLAVCIGVPILLAYVYGVVPISLLRSGGCGVTTTAGGVRINFDDEREIIIGIPGIGRGTDAAPSSLGGGPNPSIGEVSCGVSLSAESAAHLLSEADRESASIAAIAPASLAGSIASSCISRSHRLEVQHWLQTYSVASFDSSDRSAADTENASMKALAGSILRHKLNEADEDGNSTVDELRLDSVSAILTHRQTVTFLDTNDSSASNCVVLEMEKSSPLDNPPPPLRRSVSVASCIQSQPLPVRSESFPKL